MTSPFDITGKVAFVTGSSRGIGLTLATGLAKAGTTVVLHGLDQAEVDQARDGLAESTGATIHAYSFDLTAAFLVSQQVAKVMVAQGGGKIINIGSVQSQLARPSITPYAATKGGIVMLTKGLCADLAASGIQANSLAPGYIETEFTRALVEDEEFSAWVRGRTPAARWGKVDDLVGTLLFLASPAADFVNGQIIYVDGGMTAVV